MLQRGDEDDAAAFKAKNGESVEEFVYRTIAQRHGITPDGAKALVAKAMNWFRLVPLTVTFTADSVFKSPAKDDPNDTRSDVDKSKPVYGSDYKSEVEFSRRNVTNKDATGRDATPAKPGTDDTVTRTEQEKASKMAVTGGDKGEWVNNRGPEYMRWRRDKDLREARLDELAFDEQQIFGAVNPNFDAMKGTTDGGKFGENYYGSAHFLLADTVRQRVAFAVRGPGTGGAANPVVQRKDLVMMLHDMIKGGPVSCRYLDSLLLNASANSAKVMTGLDWEVHLYGGFDLTKDAKAVFLSPKVDKPLLDRIALFCTNNGIRCETYASGPPEGVTVVNSTSPVQVTVK